ncbi:hypothetical protein ACFWVC_26865 [Streptomyces sp. NPDC058691]|uniref:hypothetical protein n=1 Tax=Streptomyces sp. NPDC058691 TaxID=3346601 RepID=UPI00366264B8
MNQQPTAAPAVHHFGDTREAYDATQCREDIRDGDVLVVESAKVVGFLDAAWPVSITEEHGEFHAMATGAPRYADGRYAASIERARQVAVALDIPFDRTA